MDLFSAFSFLNLFSTPVTDATATTSSSSRYLTFALIPVLMIVFYFTSIRPQKKKQKAEQEMKDSLQIGDEITTIGGIMGRIVTVKDDVLIIETGADRVKMKITRWAIQTNDSATARIEEEKKAAEEAKKAHQEALTEEGEKHEKAKHEEILTRYEKRQRAKEEKENARKK